MVDTFYNLLAISLMAFMVGFRLGWAAHKSDCEYRDRQRQCKCRHSVIGGIDDDIFDK